MKNPRRPKEPGKVRRSPELPAETNRAVKQAGLRYVSGDEPGIRRMKARSGFVYRSRTGGQITDEVTLGRIRHLAIPPAWTEVWISPQANGHIQATGRDVRGRKQYRYHENWRAVRDENKYERMIAFARALPKIRERVARDLTRKGLGREKVLAAMVRLLEATLIRVGNEEYARQNHSFGLSTMRDRHVSIKRGTLHFEFRGKSGKQHEIDLHDAKLAEVVRCAQDLPGQELFQYLDENGARQKISSEDVNGYLRGIAGEEFSAKDFRTWAGTVLAAIALGEFEGRVSHGQAKKNVSRAIEQVAERLGNTAAICRKCYIHPAVLSSYLAGEAFTFRRVKTTEAERRAHAKLDPAEAALLAFLQRKLKAPKVSTAELLRRSLQAGARSRKKAGASANCADVAGAAKRAA